MADERNEPVLAPKGASPATASDPRVPLEDGRWHIYEANAAPWWVAILWAGFFVFGVIYLITNLIAG